MLLSFSAHLPLNRTSRIRLRKVDLVGTVLHAFRGDRACIMSLSHRDILFLCSSYELFDGVSAPSLSVLSHASLTGEYFLRKYGPTFLKLLNSLSPCVPPRLLMLAACLACQSTLRFRSRTCLLCPLQLCKMLHLIWV
jgi:hypothetical protein